LDNPFEFLQPLVALEEKIEELERLQEETGVEMSKEVESLTAKLASETRRIFDDLSAWQRVRLARHPQRPQTSDYIDHMLEDFVPLAGDRAFADDGAILCGFGCLGKRRVLLVGQQKGKDVHERRRCNFGSPHPEGYRKAMLKMRLAEKFGLPIVTLINTPGAYPGIGAEERGQSIALAENIRDMSALRTPVVSVVIGEGGSGGALAIGVCDRLLMFENSYYSVISPEGCAAILWKDGAMAETAAEALNLTAQALHGLGITDRVIEEPPGGAHRRPAAAAERLARALDEELARLEALGVEEMLAERYAKYRRIGSFVEGARAAEG